MAEEILKTPNRSSSATSRVIKALSLFGGLQILVIVCSVIRNKFVALWLGTAGVGVFALYNYTLELINQLCQLNIRQSAVREIASASPDKAKTVMGAVRRLCVLLGLVGALATLLLSPLLSRWTFGSYAHTWGFAVLAVGVGLSAISTGEQAILQASDRLKLLARSSAIGATVGTVVSIALFKLLGMKSIVPSILVFFLATTFATIFYGRRSVKSSEVTRREALALSKPMLSLGIYMTVAMALASLASYCFIAWLRWRSGENVVGLYQAGYVIVNQYVGLIFMALGIEYFPRLSKVARSACRSSLFVRHELAIVMLVVMPCAVIFINAAPLIIKLLYTTEFSSIVPFVTLGAVASVFKALSFVMAYVILARGDGKVYLVTETISALLFLLFCCFGWQKCGLLGLGVAFVFWYFAYSLIVWFVCHFRYGIKLNVKCLSLTFATVAVVGLQAFICLKGYYMPAIALSVATAAITGTLLYQFVRKRRVVKE